MAEINKHEHMVMFKTAVGARNLVFRVCKDVSLLRTWRSVPGLVLALRLVPWSSSAACAGWWGCLSN